MTTTAATQGGHDQIEEGNDEEKDDDAYAYY
jgi:hypothetical protein